MLPFHTFILKNDGTIWGCGENDYGNLGLGDATPRTVFTKVNTNIENIKSISYGRSHTAILENDNTLWMCGSNYHGQLGLGDKNNRNTFTQVTINTDNIKSVFCSGYSTFILKNDGTLWSCGLNNYGQLGLGDNTNRTVFTQVTINTDDIKTIFTGCYHAFILKNDGTLWSCGHNQYGQLGLGDTTDRTTFTQVTTNGNDVKEVYCGYWDNSIIKNDGTLWSCGLNNYGELGLGDTINRTTFAKTAINTDDIKTIYRGDCDFFILKNDNTLWACGRNDYGQLGLGDTSNRINFTQVITNADNIKSIFCSGYHSFILKNDDTLWGCGDNRWYQSGLGSAGARTTFTQVTTNTDNIQCFLDGYLTTKDIMLEYDLNTGLIETLDTNNFRNIPVNNFEKIKVLYTNPTDTLIAGLISFNNKTTWKTFDGSTWNVISDITPNNILLNGMDMQKINELDKSKLIAGGFAGDIDFRIAMKTKDVNKTPSITKIYIQYKK